MKIFLPESLLRVVSTLQEEQQRLFIISDVAPSRDAVHPHGGRSSLQLPRLGEILLTGVLGQPDGVPQQLVLVLVGRSVIVVVVIEAAGNLSLQGFVSQRGERQGGRGAVLPGRRGRS